MEREGERSVINSLIAGGKGRGKKQHLYRRKKRDASRRREKKKTGIQISLVNKVKYATIQERKGREGRMSTGCKKVFPGIPSGRSFSWNVKKRKRLLIPPGA